MRIRLGVPGDRAAGSEGNARGARAERGSEQRTVTEPNCGRYVGTVVVRSVAAAEPRGPGRDGERGKIL